LLWDRANNPNRGFSLSWLENECFAESSRSRESERRSTAEAAAEAAAKQQQQKH